MKWKECFEKYHYVSVLNGEKQIFGLDFFLTDESIRHTLKEIFISPRQDELFLIIDTENTPDVSELSKQWDRWIMGFINFAASNSVELKTIKKLKYNVIQILLFSNDAIRSNAFKLEKSVKVSRKIYIKCKHNDMDTIDDDYRIRLPFWYDEIKQPLQDKAEQEKLSNLIPDKNSRCAFMLENNGKHELLDDEFIAIEEWLLDDQTTTD